MEIIQIKILKKTLLFSIFLFITNKTKIVLQDNFLNFNEIESNSIQSAIFPKVMKKTKLFIKIKLVANSNGLCQTNVSSNNLCFYERKGNNSEICHGNFWNFHKKGN